VNWILERGVEVVWQHERKLAHQMLDGLAGCPPTLRLYGPTDKDHRCGVFSVRIDGFESPQALSDRLESEFGILTRPGIHCAPLAHRTMGTYASGGTTRLSLGPFLTDQDVAYAVDALTKISERCAAA
jgi:cysteine desulfurase/selenocysteine lyase